MFDEKTTWLFKNFEELKSSLWEPTIVKSVIKVCRERGCWCGCFKEEAPLHFN